MLNKSGFLAFLGYFGSNKGFLKCTGQSEYKTCPTQDPYGPSQEVIWIGSLDHKDIEAMGQLYHVGARFEALCKGVLMAASDFSYIFFSYPNLWICTM